MKFLEQFASNRLNLPMRLVKLAMHFVPGPSKHGEIHSSPSVHRNAALLMVHWLGKADRTLGTSDPRCQDNIYSTTTVYDLLAQSFSSRILVRHSSLASPVACVLVLEKASSAFIAKCVFRRSVRFACWAFVVALFFFFFLLWSDSGVLSFAKRSICRETTILFRFAEPRRRVVRDSSSLPRTHLAFDSLTR